MPSAGAHMRLKALALGTLCVSCILEIANFECSQCNIFAFIRPVQKTSSALFAGLHERALVAAGDQSTLTNVQAACNVDGA